MVGIATYGGRVAIDGVSMSKSAAEAEAIAIAFVSMSKSVDQIPKIDIVITEGFRRLETANGSNNWRKESKPTEGN